jgi:DNA-binding transcriptional MerR regulator
MQLRDYYTAQDVRQILRLSQRRLDYWDELGLVCPVRTEAERGSKRRGRGVQRRYSFNDLIKLKVLKDLRSTGLSLQKIQKGLRKLRRRSPRTEAFDEVLLTDGKSFERRRADGNIEDLLAGGQLIFGVMSLRGIELEIRKQIRRSPSSRSVKTKSA